MRDCQTTTNDMPSTSTLLLRIVRGDCGWIVTDTVTDRFGHAENLPDAVAAWTDDLRAIAKLDGPFSAAFAKQVEWARGVLDA